MDERLQITISAIIGMIAGGIGVLSDMEKRRIIRFVHVLRTIFLPTFLGALTAFACQGLHVDPRLAIAIAGVIAFAADHVLTVLLSFTKLKAGPFEIEVAKAKKAEEENKEKSDEPANPKD